MAFKKLPKPTRSSATAAPMVTIGSAHSNRQVYLSLNTAARRSMGDPVAIYLEFDDDAQLLRIVASSPEDPAAYPIGKSTGRISVTGIMRDLDLTPTSTHTMPAKPSGRLAVIVDVSTMRTGTVTPIRAA